MYVCYHNHSKAQRNINFRVDGFKSLRLTYTYIEYAHIHTEPQKRRNKKVYIKNKQNTTTTTTSRTASFNLACSVWWNVCYIKYDGIKEIEYPQKIDEVFFQYKIKLSCRQTMHKCLFHKPISYHQFSSSNSQ